MPKLSKFQLSSKDIERLAEQVVEGALQARSKEELTLFFNDLFTRTEKAMLGKRVLIAIFLENGYSYIEISRWLKVSQTTVNSVRARLDNDGRGLRLVISRLERQKKIEQIIDTIKRMLDRIPKKSGARWKFLYPER